MGMGLLLTLGAGCQSVPSTTTVATPPSPAPSIAASPTPAATPKPAASPNLYQRGLDRGANAANLSQNAQSRDDWRLVATLWQQAIEQLKAVPAGHPNHGAAQRKIQEYQRNLAVAQARANRPNAPAPPPTPLEAIVSPNRTARRNTASSQTTPPPSAAAQPTGDNSFRVPIVRRAGGTPVINVMFNGAQTFPMILDTGASGTVITPAMAAVLGVRPVGQARVNTASAANVAFPLGYVESVQVGGAVSENVLVAIAGPDLQFGLLGQDFFRAFDMTIRETEVEFRPR